MPKASGQWSSVEREAHSIMSMQYLCIQVCMHSAALAQIADGRFRSTYGGARLAGASARGAEFVSRPPYPMREVMEWMVQDIRLRAVYGCEYGRVLRGG